MSPRTMRPDKPRPPLRVLDLVLVVSGVALALKANPQIWHVEWHSLLDEPGELSWAAYWLARLIATATIPSVLARCVRTGAWPAPGEWLAVVIGQAPLAKWFMEADEAYLARWVERVVGGPEPGQARVWFGLILCTLRVLAAILAVLGLLAETRRRAPNWLKLVLVGLLVAIAMWGFDAILEHGLAEPVTLGSTLSERLEPLLPASLSGRGYEILDELTDLPAHVVLLLPAAAMLFNWRRHGQSGWRRTSLAGVVAGLLLAASWALWEFRFDRVTHWPILLAGGIASVLIATLITLGLGPIWKRWLCVS